MKSLLRLALEEASDGVVKNEIEHVIYGRIPDFSVLEKAASMEHQEQWEIPIAKTEKNAAKGSMRVRKTIVTDRAPEYVYTTKAQYNASGDRKEVPIPTTEDHFALFRLLSEKGMRKDRYFFPVEDSDLVWEVDVFYLPGAEVGSKQYCPWCKIDLEVPSRSVAIPPLPIPLEDVIVAPYGQRTEAEEARVTSLYANEFITRNMHV